MKIKTVLSEQMNEKYLAEIFSATKQTNQLQVIEIDVVGQGNSLEAAGCIFYSHRLIVFIIGNVYIIDVSHDFSKHTCYSPLRLNIDHFLNQPSVVVNGEYLVAKTSSSFSLPSIIVVKLNSRQTICSFQFNADDTISSVMYAFDLSHIVFVLAYTPALKILIPTKALRDVISTNLTLSAPCKVLNISSASL